VTFTLEAEPREASRGIAHEMDRSRLVVAALVAIVAGCDLQGPIDPVGTPSADASTGSDTAVLEADVDRMRDDLEALQAIADANGGVRAAGTPGYDASVDLVATELEDAGFTVETPSVEFTGFRELPGATLEVDGRTFAAPDELHALIYSPGGDLTGPVAVLDESGCDPDHFDGIAAGSLVLTTGGGCFRRDQAVNAAQAGAAALIVGYPGRGPGEIYRPTLIDPGAVEIPVVSVTDEAVGALTATTDDVHLSVETEMAPATLHNVVAQLGDGPEVVMLGAHLDSVFDGPGLNDNGSGVAALLEIARGVARTGVAEGTAIRIGLWGAEELGTIGSRAYVETMADEPVAYLNLDMAGSPEGANLVYAEDGAPEGSRRITAAYEDWFADRGEPSERIDIGGSSDHIGFRLAGIPIGGLFAGATDTGSAAQPAASAGTTGPPPDACYHLACDDLDNVDLDRVALFAEATFAVADELIGGP
jgi:Zn-dependent M28 family amino/carboxypeptidase